MNSSNHFLHRLHDPKSFAWLDSLKCEVEGTELGKLSSFLGMDTIYLNHDLLAFYPDNLIFSIPVLETPPVEYGFISTSKGNRFFCYMIIRRDAGRSAALLFEVKAYALMFPVQGLRERTIDSYGNIVIGRDYPLSPKLAVLCPQDKFPIRNEILLPKLGAYFCLVEGKPDVAPWVHSTRNNGNDFSKLNGAMNSTDNKSEKTEIYFEVGGPSFPSMRINCDEGLMNLIQSLCD